MTRPPPRSTLFPSPTLSRSEIAAGRGDGDEARRLLEPLRPHPEAERILAGLEVSSWATADDNGSGPLANAERAAAEGRDRKSTRLNSSHLVISYAVFCLKKK